MTIDDAQWNKYVKEKVLMRRGSKTYVKKNKKTKEDDNNE